MFQKILSCTSYISFSWKEYSFMNLHFYHNKLYSPWIWWLQLLFLSQDGFKDQRISFISSCLLVYRGRHLLWLHFRKELTNLKSQLSKIELSLLFKTILASDTLISYFCFVLNKVWTQFSLKQGKQIHCKKFYIKNLERGELSTSI